MSSGVWPMRGSSTAPNNNVVATIRSQIGGRRFHHGKVRVSLHASPKDQDYRDRDGRGLPVRGVRDCDMLPAVALSASGAPVPEVMLSLQPATLGLSPLTGRSWRERTGELRDRLGPGGLAFLEALIVAADRRASRLTTADPGLRQTEAER